MKTKSVVVGLGEIGRPIQKLISKSELTVGFDVNKKLMNVEQFQKNTNIPTKTLHICIPFRNNFHQNVISVCDKFSPKCLVIHSTVQPYTTKKLQNKLTIPVIFSPIRGVHKRMSYDLKRYTKFFAIESHAPKKTWAITTYSNLMKKCGVKTKKMSDPITLELAKIICDTSYYGWLINYAQMSKMIATKNNVDYDEMWTFSDEIEKFLGNRPKMRPGYIGGHCVIPNLELVQNETLNFIKKINSTFYIQMNLKKRK
tara:strand:- start:1469 stop:2236 length:768 start_codon:yes stop_codon:yes gene_type:complete